MSQSITTSTLPSEGLVRLPRVIEVTGLSKTTIYRLAHAGAFPKPVPLGETRAVAWDVAAIRDWINQRVNAAPGKAR